MTLPRACIRCRLTKEIQARGLCAQCYYWARTHGQLFGYPIIPEGMHSNYCICDTPQWETFPLYHATQCATCGKPPTPDAE